MINIEHEYLKIVQNILNHYVPDREVRIFGSRVNGQAKKYSDIDLIIVGDTKVDQKIMADIKEAFSESDLPYRVDILDWHAISPKFRSVIEKSVSEVIQKKSIDIRII